ncbi:MAG: PA2779 family protein [Candidatus Eisenbacteria bacterium]|nr:PA2779 family protein [Candidatus Eisenbacteria bacterium]
MFRLSHFLRACTVALVIAALGLVTVSPSIAGLSPSQPSGTTAITSARDADMVVAMRGLEHRVVAQKLRDYGVTPEAAQARLADMSDRDLHTLASATRGLPSGGDGTGAIIGVLLVVVLVIVIIKLTNHDVIIR